MSEPLGLTDCESLAEGVLAQPINALSSLTFLVAGSVILLLLHRSTSSIPAMTWVASALLALIGLGSFDYHGSQSAIANLLHNASILFLLALLGMVLVARLIRRTPLFPGLSHYQLLWVGVLILAGCVCYGFGRTGSALCSPASPFQWHALWHTLAAAISALIIWSMWTEGKGPDSVSGATTDGNANV